MPLLKTTRKKQINFFLYEVKNDPMDVSRMQFDLLCTTLAEKLEHEGIKAITNPPNGIEFITHDEYVNEKDGLSKLDTLAYKWVFIREELRWTNEVPSAYIDAVNPAVVHIILDVESGSMTVDCSSFSFSEEHKRIHFVYNNGEAFYAVCPHYEVIEHTYGLEPGSYMKRKKERLRDRELEAEGDDERAVVVHPDHTYDRMKRDGIPSDDAGTSITHMNGFLQLIIMLSIPVHFHDINVWEQGGGGQCLFRCAAAAERKSRYQAGNDAEARQVDFRRVIREALPEKDHAKFIGGEFGENNEIQAIANEYGRFVFVLFGGKGNLIVNAIYPKDRRFLDISWKPPILLYNSQDGTKHFQLFTFKKDFITRCLMSAKDKLDRSIPIFNDYVAVNVHHYE